MSPKIQSLLRLSITTAVVVVAALIAMAMWRHYMYSPWTREGRLRAEVVRIAPDVSGLVTEVAVRDNQLVKRGDVLFAVDPLRYRHALAQARANLDAARAAARAAGASIQAAAAGATQQSVNASRYELQYERRQRIAGSLISEESRSDALSAAQAARAGVAQAQANRQQASASQQQAVAAVEQAQAALDTAELNLERTQVRAPVDGYVTNLEVRTGDYASAGAARLALIETASFWVYGYFEETKLAQLHVGDGAKVQLMSGQELHGHIESISHGISDADSPTGNDLLANVNPTYNWVRLAQRIPVRIKLDADSLRDGVVLANGMTATVVVEPHG
ncbi:HlyD family secretion protein [Stenotrophomonas sp. Iso1]|uniref:biotin/lipoyl-binding protein n=1 Tax=Stenotrophomonas sp. Iso1 TaxID=2977283 RepID=UPI0022B78B09|nr:HlyD family secretion protein [Stenotrophomonas sp. Iso1]